MVELQSHLLQLHTKFKQLQCTQMGDKQMTKRNEEYEPSEELKQFIRTYVSPSKKGEK